MFPVFGVAATPNTPQTCSSRSYNLCGLRLKSQWEFPPPCPAAPDYEAAEVEVLCGPESLFAQARAEAGIRIERKSWFKFAILGDGGYYLLWPGLFEFLITPDGDRIFCHLYDRSCWEAFHSYLLGQVISFALIRQGIEALHCTALVIGQAAVGFLGDRGYGKSSLAAAFLQAGFPLLTDDVLVLKGGERGLLAYPGFPRIKLLPRVARTFFGPGSEGVSLNPFTRKQILPLAAGLSWQDPAPLQAIYVLRPHRGKSRPRRITIRSLSKRRGFLDLLAHTYNTAVQEPHRIRRQFALAQRLIDTIPVKSLSYPRRLAKLPQVVESVLANLSR